MTFKSSSAIARRSSAKPSDRGDSISSITSTSPPPLVFFSYCREDAYWMEILLTVFKHLEAENLIRIFHDKRSIQLGRVWLESVEAAIQEASLAICLLSPQYFASEFVRTHERPWIQERQEKGSLVVLPILLKKCLWKIDPWWASLQMFADEQDGPLVHGDRGDETERVQARLVDLALEVWKLLSELPEPPEPTRPAPVVLLGPSSVGKSSLLNATFGSSNRSRGPKSLDASTTDSSRDLWDIGLRLHLYLFRGHGGDGPGRTDGIRLADHDWGLIATEAGERSGPSIPIVIDLPGDRGAGGGITMAGTKEGDLWNFDRCAEPADYGSRVTRAGGAPIDLAVVLHEIVCQAVRAARPILHPAADGLFKARVLGVGWFDGDAADDDCAGFGFYGDLVWQMEKESSAWARETP